MKCSVCRKKAVVSLPYMPQFCKQCFCRVIEKRIRKYVRINKIFSKNDRIYVKDGLCKHLVKNIIKDLPVKYVSSKRKANKIISKQTADDICIDFLNSVFNNKPIKTKQGGREGEINKLKQKSHQIWVGLWGIKTNKANQKQINILWPITDEEALLFAKYKKIKFRPDKKNKDIKKFIDKIQNKYPETKFSLVKSCEFLN